MLKLTLDIDSRFEFINSDGGTFVSVIPGGSRSPSTLIPRLS